MTFFDRRSRSSNLLLTFNLWKNTKEIPVTRGESQICIAKVSSHIQSVQPFSACCITNCEHEDGLQRMDLDLDLI